MADQTAWIERGRRRRHGSPGNQFPRRRGTVGHRSWPNSAFSGLIRLGSGSGMISVPCVIDLGHQVGTGTLWAGTSTAGRNFTAAHRRSAAFQCFQGYGLPRLAPKERADRNVAHRGLGSKGESGAGARRRTLAARRCGARGPVAEVVLRVSGSEVSTREAPAGILEGSGGFEVAGSEEIAEASRLTRGGAPGKSRPLQVMGSCGEASGSFLGLRRSRSGGL